MVIQRCTKTFDQNGDIVALDDSTANQILDEVVSRNYCSNGLRCIAIAYKDQNQHGFEQMARECKGFQDENDKEALERDLTLIGVFALQDDLRPKIQNSV